MMEITNQLPYPTEYKRLTMQRDIGGWGDTTFGQSTASSVLYHLCDELVELTTATDELTLLNRKYYSDDWDRAVQEALEEAADCAILLGHFGHKNGFVVDPGLEVREPWMPNSLSDIVDRLNTLYGVLERGKNPTVARYMVALLHDVAFLLNGNLYDAVESKFLKNKARKWGTPDSRGVVSHVD